MKRKWLIGILATLTCILGIIGFTACKNESNNLKFALSKDGKSYSVVGFTGKPTQVDIPATHRDKPVTSIGDNAFLYCFSLKSVTIPDSVTYIGAGAFWSCSSLTSITIPDSVTDISTGAFYDCPIENATIPAFAIINIPKYDLKSVIITSGSSIGKEAFKDSYALKSVTIGKSVIEIGEDAFYACTSLTSITIPNNVTEMGDGAFYACTSLTSVTIGSGVKSIGISAFSGCTLLETIAVASENTNYHSAGNCLIETKSKTLISGCKKSIIPTDGSVTSIGSHAFFGHSALTSITIPDSVTKIGFCAFRDCTSLESVTIGTGVTSIDHEAFWRCSSLTSVTFKKTTGWRYSISWTETSGTRISSTDLADPATAARYLTDTYCNYHWHRDT